MGIYIQLDTMIQTSKKVQFSGVVGVVNSGSIQKFKQFEGRFLKLEAKNRKITNFH